MITNEQLTNVAGFKAVMEDGTEETVSVNQLAYMVASCLGLSTNGGGGIMTADVTATAAGDDTYENQLPVQTDFANVRTLDSNGNPTQVTKASLASVVGGTFGLNGFNLKPQRIPDETDLNTITSFGFYAGGTGQRVINGPTGVPNRLYMLIVYGYNDNRLIQIFATANSVVRSRDYDDSNTPQWSAWQ